MLIQNYQYSNKFKPQSNILREASGHKSQHYQQAAQKKLGFGSVGTAEKLVKKSGLAKRAGSFVKKVFKRILVRPLRNLESRKDINQNFANAINYGGKSLISPLMILAAAPFTDEEDKSIKYSMLMQPLQAGLAFASSLGLSILANKSLKKFAEKGTLGKAIDPRLGEFFKNEAHFKQFKSYTTAAMTMIAIPFTSALLVWSLPKIMKKINHDTPDKIVHRNMYAEDINATKTFAGSIRPEFGLLTSKVENTVKEKGSKTG